MNREILFRGRTLTTWIYGYLYIDEKEICHIRDNNIGDVFVNKTTIGQYTGLCDKEGNKIFEGDIVTLPTPVYVGEIIYKVIYKDYGWFLKNELSESPLFEYLQDRIKIIGNIHDNSNLIKEEGE